MGLAISKRFVEMMGGDIHINSELGIGSTFAFILTLPTVDVVPESLRQPDRAAPTPLVQRVLIVDDNPIAGELTRRSVRSWGWSADLVSSGDQALEMVTTQCADGGTDFPYPVIFTDWKMAGMDGWATTRQIREQARLNKLQQPVVIMITGHGREMLSQRTEDEQDMINGFLVKPVTASMLYDALMDAGSGSANVRKIAKGRSSTRQLAGMRILVVEDNLINQQVADELLTAAGAIVSLATNGQLGVDAVAAAAPQFDVVLMDVQMPVLDGYGATRAIREDLGFADLPIVAMTANAMDSDREACLACGMNEHVGKPFDMKKLVSVLIRMTKFQVNATPQDTPEMSAAHALLVPTIADLDLHTALGRMSGMRALYVRTARDFVKIMDTVAPELQHCLKTGDRKKAVMRLHTLKGNAGTLGVTDLALKAAELEKMCVNEAGMLECQNELVLFAEIVGEAQNKLNEAIALLDFQSTDPEPVVGTTTTAAPPAVESMRAALHRIAALASASDLEALQEFAQSRDLLSGLPAESVDHLDEALQNLELEAAGALCEKLLSQLLPANL